jgi:hypothetical protein
MQLYDQSKAVSLAAIAILGEATEEKVTLRILTSNTVHFLRCSLYHDVSEPGYLSVNR